MEWRTNTKIKRTEKKSPLGVVNWINHYTKLSIQSVDAWMWPNISKLTAKWKGQNKIYNSIWDVGTGGFVTPLLLFSTSPISLSYSLFSRGGFLCLLFCSCYIYYFQVDIFLLSNQLTSNVLRPWQVVLSKLSPY